ncbi:uncharacterized protein TRIADDRAFT_23741 [Trichoplax adhaerens]|uniref:beta-N-acetylhexosaminidase n=1 Tax=Trichoplax adhaerens TaxID=10228 RepID=B3RUQ4_TRIAD|nr:hypothetical protein TRIADDRAFT_23741 [Trichoplax adhaerens]EDV25366.1 hypothetical protein TRIADDRAFT_23741 [Trichoplax adhaerens]|eukprot:XP_002111399.1 hypothetical protein TRIADDRAFT_23741 [Trichoplax adhaerens]
MDVKIYDHDGPHQFKGKKIVHLDLKGAPPKLSYYKPFFSIMASLGVDGILMEYEDMFPYSGSMEVIRREEAYTNEEIETIKRWAEEKNLELIPLVQTFGHLEFVLKHDKFSSLSEIPKPRRAICPSNHQSLVMLKELIDQVMTSHPHTKYFHVGGDEVYELAKCAKCKEHNLSRKEIYVRHVIAVYKYIKSKWPNVNVLFWEDMIRTWTIPEMEKLKGLVPMVWAYRRNLDDAFPDNMWENYEKVFQTVWIASAFKGALAPDNDLVPIDYHTSNHLSWMKIIKFYQKIKFEGIAVTGWSRFDHYQPLCELLPAGIPSLALCIGILNFGNLNNQLVRKVSNAFRCQKNISLSFSFQDYIQEKCHFPGSKTFAIISKWKVIYSDLMVLRRFFNDPMGYHVYKDKAILAEPKKSIRELDQRINAFIPEATLALNEIYYPNTVNEWVASKKKAAKDLLISLQQYSSN